MDRTQCSANTPLEGPRKPPDHVVRQDLQWRDLHRCVGSSWPVVSVSPSSTRLIAFDFASRAADLRGLLAPPRSVRRETDAAQELVGLICGEGRQALEDVLNVGEGVDLVVPEGAGQRVQESRRTETSSSGVRELGHTASSRRGCSHDPAIRRGALMPGVRLRGRTAQRTGRAPTSLCAFSSSGPSLPKMTVTPGCFQGQAPGPDVVLFRSVPRRTHPG